MSTLQTANDALLNVAQTYIKAQTGDATWGNLYTAVRFRDVWPYDTYDWPTITVFEIGGKPQAQGLGTIKQWRHQILRVDAMCGRLKDSRQLLEQVRTAWINDINFTPETGSVGKGYLRQTGGIKYLEFINDPKNAPLDKRNYFRRVFDIQIEIGD